MHPLWYHAVLMLTTMPLRMLAISPILFCFWIWQPNLWILPSPTVGFLFLISVSLAWCIGFLVQAIFGLLAFWLDRTDSIFGMWFSCWMLASGYLAPLSLFPEEYQGIISILPFYSTLGVPVELLAGLRDPFDAISALAIQGIWFVISLLFMRWLWERGILRYGAFGA